MGVAALKTSNFAVVRDVAAASPQVAVSLDTVSDSGASHSDGVTNITAPAFDVTINQSGSITLTVDGSAVGNPVAASAGTVTIRTTTALADGPHTVQAIFTPTTGAAVTASTTITIDTVHPTVVAGAATEQAPLFSRTLTFSKAMDASTLSASNITVAAPDGSAVPVASITGSKASYVLTFGPLPIYLPGRYSVTVHAPAADLAGNSLIAPVSDSFNLLADVTGPSVADLEPSRPTNQNVSSFTVKFNEPILLSSFTPSQVSITGPLGPLNLSQATITSLDPQQESFQVSFPTQSAEGRYAVSIGPKIFDLSGNAMSIVQVTNDQFLTPPTDLTLNGSATYLSPGSVNWTPNGMIRLTSATMWQDGSVFLKQSEPADPFTVSFDFNIHDGGGAGNGADGFTFIVAQNPNQGASGGGLGYIGYPGASFAVEFDTYNNGDAGGYHDLDNSHIGIDWNGADSALTAHVDPLLGGGNTFHAIIHFDGVSLVSVTVQSPDGHITTRAGTVPADAVPSQYTFGFTGSTGAGYEDTDVTNFSVSLQPTSGGKGAYSSSFTIDKTPPTIDTPTIAADHLSVHVADNVGLDPTTIMNVANYALGAIVNGSLVDESADISSISFNASSGIATIGLKNALPDGIYQLTVHGAGITDLAGNLLLQGADYTQVLVLGTLDLQVGSVSGPANGFNSQPALVSWSDSNGGTIPITGPWVDNVYAATDAAGDNPALLGSFVFTGTLAVGASVQRTQQVALPSAAGTYWFMVVTNATHTVPEGANAANDTAIAAAPVAVSSVPLPDLVVTSITPPPNGAFSGASVPISFVVKNQGPAPTSVPAWTDWVILSQDPTLAQTYQGQLNGIGPGGDQTLNNQPVIVGFSNPSYLGPGQSYQQNVTATLPLSAQGSWYVYVVPDGTGAHHPFVMPEVSRTDKLLRSAAFSVTLSPPPDLTVKSVQAPAQLFSGQAATISWTVANIGTGPTAASAWTDSLYMSPHAVLDASATPLGTFTHQGALAAGSSYTASQTVNLPVGVSGSFNFLVMTDAASQVFENGATANNVGATATAVTVNLTPPPDLEVSAITAPASALAGHTVSFSYTATDAGAGGTPNFTWTDAIYLSPTAAYNSTTAMTLGETTHVGSLDAGAGYTNSVTETLPANLTGSYYILVDIDNGNAVFELNKTNNWSASPAAIRIAQAPADLVVGGVSAPGAALPASAILVNWTVLNQGGSDPVVSSWQDDVYIDPSAALDSSAILLGSYLHRGPLNAGVVYTQSQLVTLPLNLLGSYNLFVVANASGTAPESTTTNNTSAALPIAIRLQLPGGGGPGGGSTGGGGPGGVQQAQVSDLQPTAVLGPTTALTGGSVTGSWTVQNNGPGTTNSDYWYDDVWLSTRTTLASGGTDVYLGTVQHTNPLAAGATYTASGTFALSRDLTAGNYYFIVAVDRPVVPPGGTVGNLVDETNETNNELAQTTATAVSLAPTPELNVSAVTVPSTATSGGQLAVGWTVTNNGAATGNMPIVDSLYLSYDRVFDTTDRYLASVTFPGGLAGGASYTQNVKLALPSGVSGTFYVFVETDSDNAIYERNPAVNAAYSAQSVQINLPLLADLVAGTVTIPAGALAGENITITYQVSNNGKNAANGSWLDSLYLSPTTTWTVGDPLLGQVAQTQNVAPGGSYAGTLTAPLPGVAPGSYYVIVRSNILDNLPEVTQSNNLSASLTQTAIDATALTLGQSTSFALTQGQSAYFKVAVSAGETLQFSLQTDADTASNELYVSFDTMPGRAQSDFRALQPLSAAQTITVPTTQAGNYYILAYAGSLQGSSEEVSLKAAVIPFSVTNVAPATVAKSGRATLEIDGALFDRATTFQLHGPNGLTVAPIATDVQDASTAYVTFDLTGLPVGNYTVAAARAGGATTQLPNGLTVQAGTGGGLQTSLTGPALVLVGGIGSLNVNYANAENNDVGAPLIYVLSPSNSALGMDATYVVPNRDLAFLAISPNGPPGILRPGTQASRTVYFQAPTTPGAPNTFQIVTVAANDTDPIDWSKIQPWILAERTASPNWPAAYALLQQWVGPTWGGFVTVLDQNAGLVVPGGADPSQPDEILDIVVQKAIAAVNTSLSGMLQAQDLSVPIAGQGIIASDAATGQTFEIQSFANGSFVFPTLPAGTYTLSVDGAVVTSDATVTVAAGQALTGVMLTIASGAKIEGRIVDQATGQGIAGASVLAVSEADGASVEATSDATGYYAFSGLEFAIYDLIVNAPGYARAVQTGIDVSEATAVESIAMVSQAVIAGSLQLPSGGPGEGTAQIVADLAGSADPNQRYSAATSSSFFALSGLPAGSYDLTITLDGYITQTLTNEMVSAGQTLNLGTIDLTPASTISGTVTSNDPSIPAANQLIAVISNGVQIATGESDSSGNFSITGLSAGTYTLEVPNAGPYSVNPVVTIGLGESLGNVSIVLEPGGEIAGNVTDTTTSQTLAGVTVFAANESGQIVQAMTDASGSYRFSGLATGTYQVYLLVGGAHASQSASVTNVDGSVVTANLQLAVAAHLGGQLVDASGNPITDGEVILYFSSQPIATARTDAAGRYDFSILQPGTFDLVASSTSASFAPIQGVVVGTGETINQDFHAGAGTLRVMVSDSSQMVEGATVELTLLGAPDGPVDAGSGAVSADGTASFANLVAGNYQVSVDLKSTDRGQAMASVLAVGSTNLNVTLSPMARVSGRITDASGDAIAGASIILQSTTDPNTCFTTETMSDGTFSLTGVTPNLYDVSAFASGYQASIQQAIAVSGNTTVNAALSASVTTITGKLLDNLGDPVPSGEIVVSDPSGHIIGSTTVRPDGTFELTTAQGLSLKLMIFSQGYLVPAPIMFSAPRGTMVLAGSIVLEPVAIDPAGAVGSSASIADPAEGQVWAEQWEIAVPAISAEVIEQNILLSSFNTGASCPACTSASDQATAALAKVITSATNVLVQGIVVEVEAFQLDDTAAAEEATLLNEVTSDFAQANAVATALNALAAASPLISGSSILNQAIDSIGSIEKELASLAMVVNSIRSAVNSSSIAKAASQASTLVSQIVQNVASLSTIDFSLVLPSGTSAAFAQQLANVEMSLNQLSNRTAQLPKDPFHQTTDEAAEFQPDVTKLSNFIKTYSKMVSAFLQAFGKLQTCEDANCGQPTNSNQPPNGNPPSSPSSPQPQPPLSVPPSAPHDPNAIIGPHGFGDDNFVSVQQTLLYTVLFENSPTASAPAQQVVITQQLDPNLDWRTFRLGSFGWAGTIFRVPANSAYYQTRIDLTQTQGYYVDVTATIDERTGIATWTFTTIDPATGEIPIDPAIGFLGPDDASGSGEGFVSYTIMAQQTDPTGTIIAAQATVTFSTQPPLKTPQIFNTIDAGTNLQSSVAPLPAYEFSTPFTVSWSGTDAANGSAIASYTIYVSDNGGPYTVWLANTTLTSAPFAGREGHTYSFLSVAVDNAGNRQPLPTLAQASTWVYSAALDSTVAPLPARENSLSFTIAIRGGQSAGLTVPIFYDIYVSSNGGAWTLWTTVSSVHPSATFHAAGNTSYGFYSVARDSAGNAHPFVPVAQAATFVPDLTPPTIHVTAVTAATATFVVSWSGTASGGSGLAGVDLYVSVDGGVPSEFAHAVPGSSVNGVYSGSATFAALRDGRRHTYRFYGIGINGSGRPQAAPARGDVTITALFSPASLQVTGFSVQHGLAERSFIRYLDVSFNLTGAALNGLTTSSVRLLKFNLDGSGPGQPVSLANDIHLLDHVLEIDFGGLGLGASPTTTAADGYYQLQLDLDGNGTFETELDFYRLLGDVNGDRVVDSIDLRLISQALGQSGANLNADITGDGLVNAADLLYATRSLGRRVGAGLHLDA